MDAARFRRIVWAHYKKHGRHHLPWRETRDSYRILVSEIMLQQTQVDRVIPFYKYFIRKFGTAKKLAQAPLSEVLKAWQGLGYNRRAKMLQAAAKELVRATPISVEEWQKLPGVGPYTARAVSAFVSNEDVIVIETNIRTAVIHHFYPTRKKVSDALIEKALIESLPLGKAREWYSALMDYGSHLKRSGVTHNKKSSTYTKQARFAGSLREVRGSILRTLSMGPTTEKRLLAAFPKARAPQLKTALTALLEEGFITKKDRSYQLAD